VAALVPNFLAAPEITTGRLALLDEAELPTLEHDHLSIKESRRSEPALDTRLRWIKQESGRSERSPPGERLKLVQP
jgi:LysR family glycine cleavage system transcriptional activator